MSRPNEARSCARANRGADSPASAIGCELGAESGREYPSGAGRRKLGGDRMRTTSSIPPSVSGRPGLRVVNTGFDVAKVRRDFPILSRAVRGKKLVYLDNAATAQKPRAVIDAISRYYEQANANIHRGVHFLSEHATEEHERSRRTVQSFVNAAAASEIIFVRGATEA